MSFQQGLSGLNAASKNLEVIGNNVANASTVGFKQSQAVFSDVYARSLSGGGGSQIGVGTKMDQVVQQFTQGNISTTNNPLDLSINGNGFFRMENNGAVTYTRNGQFQLDKAGYIVNANGSRLTGYQVNANGELAGGAPQELNISSADLAPRATGNAQLVINLDSRSEVPASTPFVASDSASYNYTTSLPVYDSLGNMHTLQTYYVKTGNGDWDIYGSLNGQTLNAGAAIGQLEFDENGALTAASQATMPFGLAMPMTNGAATPLTVQMDYRTSTQTGSSSGVTTLLPDGYAPGRLAGFGIGNDGTILGRYTNGESAILGQVALATFTNANGLEPLGDNTWGETPNSGPALVGSPGSGTLGLLRASTVEESNVDLTAELVRMITAQRNYQANAQTIKTQDQAMQTLVNMR
jgi:flagellar hook protein FlgE